MADNWSASPVTLTDAGDWAKWTITLGSGDADDLNNVDAELINYVTLRMALSAANREGRIALIVNDTVAMFIGASPPQLQFSSFFWVSANRFKGGSAGAVFFGASLDFPQGGVTNVLVSPWVAGTNTVRLLWYGDEGDPEPIEIDFLAIQTGEGFALWHGWPVGNDNTDDIKPVNYDAHADPDPIETDGKATWILEGGGATTGTAGDSILEVIKFCPPVAKIRVTGAGSPVAGVAGMFNETSSTPTVTTLDGAGEATFDIGVVPADIRFWYGGNDDWTPASVGIEDDERIGCAGWYVGCIAMASLGA